MNIDSNTGMTIIGINWIRGNKKAFVTNLPTKMWEQFQRIAKFDRHDVVAAHSITKRDADILYVELDSGKIKCALRVQSAHSPDKVLIDLHNQFLTL